MSYLDIDRDETMHDTSDVVQDGNSVPNAHGRGATEKDLALSGWDVREVWDLTCYL
jgi:hypothetical protein